ncbi:hypothetical protein NQ315_008647 [Exocentrus adspersus]|uniref:Uncharacterized protein n=1 Tax=Exocentrus adspersus TaxID=1586481 RepID=A0AAV8W6C3_9CUCU|nr:hypothetical protein NQ315_008647 [Exocentrus adspersus]
MQQQQLAAQLAHHGGGGRQPQLSPTPSESDSDISLGAHSPPISSPGPLRFGSGSPNPITSFRFGAHSPGPMPAQFRFGTNTPPSFRMERQSPTPPNFRLDRKLRNSESPINVDSAPSNYTAVNLRLSSNESPIDVDSNTDYRQEKGSPIRVDGSPPQTSLQPSPPMNLRIADNLRVQHSENVKIETPLPLRLGHQLNSGQISAGPLRIQVTSSGRLGEHTSLHGGHHPHGGIVRIAPPSPSGAPVLHRPFSPPRLT